MDGGSRVAKVLRAQGIECVFTLVGGHISPILVACKREGIRVVDTRHEANAVFAADAVGRLTGVPGVAAVTAGPGVANAITAVKNAQMAQSPLVLLGGATATLLRGRGSLQDIDQLALIRPHVKWIARPSRLRDVIPALEKAFDVARAGVPGPVFVELAVDLLYPEPTVREMFASKTQKSGMSLAERGVSLYVRGHLKYVFAGSANHEVTVPEPVEVPSPRAHELRQAEKMVREAKRPVMILGSQVMLRTEQLGDLVSSIEKLNIPVYLSGMARGLLGRNHPLQLRHKRRKALKEADLIVLCGVPADFRLDYGLPLARARVIGVNLSEKDLKKNRRPNLGLLCDPHAFLLELARSTSNLAERDAWLDKLRARDQEREGEIEHLGREKVNNINPLALCKVLEEKLSDKSVLVGDGGDFVATAAYSLRPRGPLSWLDPGVFGTLGVGAGFALGAKLVRPEAEVWLLYGDGAAGFSLMEFDTFVRHKIPVIALIGNDGCWTQIARDQVPILGDDVACNLAFTDYHKVVEGLGAKGLRVDNIADLPKAIEQAQGLAREGHPVVLNAILGKTEFRKGSISL